jgi:hypothetical protein
MHIDWQALSSVFGVSLVATISLVGLFTLGIVGLGKNGAVLARSGAYACFALCAGAVAYGIFLIVV